MTQRLERIGVLSTQRAIATAACLVMLSTLQVIDVDARARPQATQAMSDARFAKVDEWRARQAAVEKEMAALRRRLNTHRQNRCAAPENQPGACAGYDAESARLDAELEALMARQDAIALEGQQLQQEIARLERGTARLAPSDLPKLRAAALSKGSSVLFSDTAVLFGLVPANETLPARKLQSADGIHAVSFGLRPGTDDVIFSDEQSGTTHFYLTDGSLRLRAAVAVDGSAPRVVPGDQGAAGYDRVLRIWNGLDF